MSDQSHRSDLALLRSADPVDDATLPDARSMRAQALFRSLGAAAPQASRRRVRPTRVAALVALPVLVAGTAAAGWAVTHRPATNYTALTCAAVAEADSDITIIEGTADPIGACASMWASGQMEAGSHAVPPLSTCVSTTGVLMVIPKGGDDACTSSGLAEPDDVEQFTAAAGRVTAVIHDIAPKAAAACIGRDEAIAMARASLDAHGLEGWTIQADPETEVERCAHPSEVLTAGVLPIRMDPA